MDIRNELLSSLRERLDRFVTDQDSGAILSRRALHEVNALLDEVPDPSADPEVLIAAAYLYWYRYEVLPSGEGQRDLRAALTIFALIYRTDPGAVPDSVLSHLAEGSWRRRIPAAEAQDLVRTAARLAETGNPRALDKAVDLLRQAVAATPDDRNDRCRYLFALDDALETRFRLTGARADIDEAIDAGRQAVALLPPGHTDHASALTNLGNALGMRFAFAGEPDDLEEAIKAGKQATANSASGHPARAQILSNLGTNLLARFQHAGQAVDLDEAIELWLQAAAATAPGHTMREAILGKLVSAFLSRFERAGDLADLDGAVQAQRQLVTAASSSGSARTDRQAVLGELLLDRFLRRNRLADLDEAIEMDRQAAVSGDPGTLVNLATGLQTRYRHIGKNRADLDDSIENYQQAMARAPVKSRVHMLASSGLSCSLLFRYEYTGNTADLEAAIEAARRAAAELQNNGRPADRADILSNLGNTLRRSFERYGNLADLDEAITVSREATAATPESDPEAPMRLSNFAGILYRRFEVAGELAFLDEAIEINQRAVAANPDPPYLAVCLGNLGTGLRNRFERTGDQADLDQAIVILGQALAATPSGHADRPRRLSDLANALQTRFRYGGTPEDLDEAVEASKQALAAMPADHADRARYLVNLGIILAARAEGAGADGDLDQAIDSYQQALAATLPSHPIRAAYLVNLAAALQTKFTRTKAPADLSQLVQACEEAASTVTAPAHIRARAARLWGRAAAGSRDWASAADGYAAAVELLGRVAPRGLGRSDQEYWLGEFAGVGNEAAACFLQAGQPGRAVEMWEHGRGVMLSQTLDTRADLAQLRQRHPRLATEFVRLCEELDGTADNADLSAAQEIDHRRKLADDLDQVIGKIREQQDFERFLLPPAAGELLSAAGEGPIVLLNVSGIRSDALLLTPAGVQVVPLPEVSPSAVAGQVAAFMNALEAYVSPGMAGRAEQQLSGVLAWIWASAARPVLDHLGLTARGDAAGGRGPRIWWCPSGLLAFLPLHAAGDHGTRLDEVPQTVLDRVVSSYTPTVRALTHARRAGSAQATSPGTPAGSGRLLVVAMPHTPDEPPLREAVNEAIHLRDVCPGQATILHGDLEPAEAARLGSGSAARADYGTVRAALPRHRWAHFACHAASDITTPSASHLVLADHQTRPLTVVDLAQLRLAAAELAFLSACSTARTGRPRLADEAIHLSAAFQLAGYRHVIATLWPIEDRSARYVATQFYTRLISGQVLPPAADAAALILHDVIVEYRNSLEARSPWRWAAHLHSGG